MCFLHVDIFFCSGRGSFVVLSAPGRARSPPEHHDASEGPGRSPWYFVWRFKVQVTAGRQSEHTEPSRLMQTDVQVKKMTDGSRDM